VWYNVAIEFPTRTTSPGKDVVMEFGFTVDPFGTVGKVIRSWRPRGCKTEKDYRESLKLKLQKELGNQKIQPDYGRGSQHIDIVVDGKVPIEIRKDLKSTGSLKRTIGQLDRDLKDWKGVFLVLCGEIRPDLVTSLKQYAKKQTGGLSYPFSYEKVEIIVKK
jgi:hypothetical protein